MRHVERIVCQRKRATAKRTSPPQRENVCISKGSERRRAPREEAGRGGSKKSWHVLHTMCEKENLTISYLREQRRTDMYARKMGDRKGVRHPRAPQPIIASHSALQRTSLCRHSSQPLVLWVSVVSSLSRLLARHCVRTPTSFAGHISSSDMWTEAGEP